MKSVIASATLFALLFASACSQSPEKLMIEANKYRQNKKYDEASILYQKILVKDKTNAEAYYRLGLNYLDQGKAREAVPALRRAVDLQPTNTDAVTKLAEIYLAAYSQNPKEGKKLVEDINQLDGKLLQQDQNSFEGLRIKGLIAALINRDMPAAEANMAKANAVKPYSRSLVDVYARILSDTGKRDQAIALLNDDLTHDKTWDAGYNLLTILYLQAGQRDKVDAILHQHVAADPTSTTALVNYASFRQQTGDFAGAEQLMQKMTKDPKSFPNAQMLLGDFYIRAKKPDQAKAAWEQGKKDDSKNAVQYDEKLLELQAATGHVPDALNSAKELADKNPKDASATALYGDLLIKTNTRDKSAKTIEEIRKMSDNNPSNTMLRYFLAKAYFESGDREKSLTAVQQAITDVQKTGRAQPAFIPAEVLEARIYGDRGEHAKALELTNSVLGVNRGSVSDPTIITDARIIRDRALIATGKADDAQKDLEDFLQRAPNLLEPHVLMGDLYIAQHQFDKATAQYEIAAKSTPPDRRALIGLQMVKLASGHSAEAVQGMQDMVSKNPSDPAYRFELARFQTTAAMMPPNVGQPAGKQLLQQAEDNYKQIVAASPSAKDEVWMNLGMIQRALGQNDSALASFEQAATINPKNVDSFRQDGLLLEALNRKKEAIDDYNKVLNIKPDDPVALNNLAMMSAESGSNLDQAQTYAERAKKGAPESPDIADTLGFVYLQKNLNTQAAEIFRENVQKYPQVPAFRFHLAMALLKQGDKQGAKEQADKALQGAAPDLQNKIKVFVGQIG